ncbi:MAG: hypothetical protein Q7R49_06895 [Candidatus Daviesbacteria bacterium]|nr:hypothetical protein [Candidatus Daviesbacteria bacterium]
MATFPETSVTTEQPVDLSNVGYYRKGWDFVFHLFNDNFSEQEVIEAPMFVARSLRKIFPFEKRYRAVKLRKIGLKSAVELADSIEGFQYKDLLKFEREMLESEIRVLKDYPAEHPYTVSSAKFVDRLFRNFEVTLIAKYLQD